MKNIFARSKSFIKRRKKTSALVFLVLILAGVGTYRHYASGSAVPSYTLAVAEKGTLVVSVSGTGQVAALHQTDIAPEVSGDITSVLVKPGDKVYAGQTIARMDNRDAVKAVENAALALENAKLAYDKAAKQSNDQKETSSVSDIKKAYESGYNAIANAFIDMPTIFMGVNDVFYTPSHSPYFTDNEVRIHVNETALGYKNQAGIAFDAARREYEANFSSYKTISADSKPEEISSLLSVTNSILKKLLASLSATYSTVDYISDNYIGTTPSEIGADKNQLSGYVSKVNSNITSVTKALDDIENAKGSATTAELSMRSAELSRNQSEDSLRDARQALADHDVKAPYDGVIAKVPAKAGDKVTSNTTIATIITEGKIVNITLNEIDAAKVKTGDKATLSFDAIDDLSLAGHVSNVDLVGTVSQGVVSYAVEITFDDNDDRVKPGMTVNANIITDAKTEALIIPSSAVKNQGGNSYVQVFSKTYGESELSSVSTEETPSFKPVTLGLSNDTSVEVLSGLSEGEQVISKVTSGAKAAAAAPSIFGAAGGRATGGNTVRMITR